MAAPRIYQLRFTSLAEAVTYARHDELDAEVETAQSSQFRPKTYADNFAASRAVRWSHWLTVWSVRFDRQ